MQAVTSSSQPTKEQARQWLQERAKAHNTPLPSIAEIRRQLGWKLINQ
jgi:hypothetical protein